jgi:hypothetical protein
VATRTRRRWRVGGMIGPADVHALQTRVHDYASALQVTVDRLAASAAPLPLDNSKWSIQSWGDLAGRVSSFESESTNAVNPFAHIYAGSTYERGRQLITELDAWRDELARRAAAVPPSPNMPPVPVPAPVDVPRAEVSLFESMGSGVLMLAVLYLLSQWHGGERAAHG